MTSTPELSLGDLVEHTGFTARTIRFYTSRGLLPQPGRRGRQAVYSPNHRVRLELIRELQARGLSLDAIARSLSELPDDASESSLVLHATLLAPWLASRSEQLSRAELAEWAGWELSDEEVRTLIGFGIAAPEGAGFRVSTALLPLGVQLLHDGVDAAAAEAAHAVFTRHGRLMAEELAAIYDARYRPGASARGATAADISVVVERFKAISIAALVSAYEDAVERIRSEAAKPRSEEG